MNEHIYHDAAKRGTILRVNYTATIDGEDFQKYANVYLPYGYDAADKSKKYDILYLLHGGGGNPDAWLDTCQIKNALDLSFDNGYAKPFIVVFPTYYNAEFSTAAMGDPRKCILDYQTELVEILLPVMESQLNVYAASTSAEDLKAARDHRAISGFSMGAGATWFAFTHNLDYFSTFVPLSGDCWELALRGGKECPEQTAALLKEIATPYCPDGFRILAATGTKDIAYENMEPMVAAMRKMPETFVETEDLGAGNFHYFAKDGAVHAYEEVYHYLYHYLPYLFK